MQGNKRRKFYRAFKETLIHLVWLSVFLIPILGVVNMAFIVVANTQRNALEEQLKIEVNQELNMIDLYINAQIQVVHDDLHVVDDANDTQTYLSDPSAVNFTEFQNFLMRISTNKDHYVRTRIISLSGDVLFQITRTGDTLSSSDTNLGNIVTESYFTSILQLTEQKTYISKLHIVNNQPVITFIIPLLNDGQIIQYYLIDYDANSFLTVFQLYAQDELNHFSLGLTNDNRVWVANDTFDSVEPITDSSLSYRIMQNINDQKQIATHVFDIRKDLEHYAIDVDNAIMFYIQYDLKTAIAASDYFLLNNLWVIIVANISLLLLAFYIAFLTRSKNAAQLQANANAYLSAQNQNAIIISDSHLRFIYVNHAFETIYGYKFDEIYLKNVQKTLQVPGLHPDINFKKDSNFETHNWDRTKFGAYVLKFITIKQQMSFANRDKHFIGVLSEPHIELDDYITYVSRQDQEVAVIKQLLQLYPFKLNKSTLMLIRFSQADSYKLAHFLKSKLTHKFLVCIPKENHIMLYVNVTEVELDQTITEIDDLMDYYRYLPKTSKDFTDTFTIARADHHLNTIESLIDAVITAMAYTKDHQQLRHSMYTPNIKKLVERKHFIFKALENGFKHHEFYLNYQIQKNIKTNEFTGAEALLRWNNAILGPIGPYEFIPIIEDSFYINRLSIMVLNLAIKDLKDHLDELPPSFRISINLSAFDFSSTYIINQLLSIIEKSNVPATRFIFEITESIYVDNIKATNDILDNLHKRGIKVAIDDFGTGYSSINSLQSINIDYVKTDRQFIKNYPETDDAQMLKRMIRLIHSLHKPVVVEGTETDEHIDFCLKNRVEYMQGYVITKPIAFKDMINQFLVKKKD